MGNNDNLNLDNGPFYKEPEIKITFENVYEAIAIVKMLKGLKEKIEEEMGQPSKFFDFYFEKLIDKLEYEINKRST